MFYAWETALAFQKGERPMARAKSEPAIIEKMASRYKKYFTAFLVDGTWVDLTTYGHGLPPEGRGVSDERTARYIRGRKRALEQAGEDEVNQNTPLIYNEDAGQNEPDSEPVVRRHSESGQEFFSVNQAPEADLPTTSEAPAEVETATPPTPDEHQEKQQLFLAVDPAVVKAIFEFLALKEEQRVTAINALSALSISAAPFKQAVEVMLDDSKELVVSLATPAPPEVAPN